MLKEELHDLVQEYWIKCGKNFRPYYLHQNIDHEEVGNKIYDDFMEYVNEKLIQK